MIITAAKEERITDSVAEPHEDNWRFGGLRGRYRAHFGVEAVPDQQHEHRRNAKREANTHRHAPTRIPWLPQRAKASRRVLHPAKMVQQSGTAAPLAASSPGPTVRAATV